MAMLMQLVPMEAVKISGGVVVREYHIPAGAHLVSHKHPYDHFSILFSGSAMLTRGDEMIELHGPRMVEIKAGIAHEIYARTDCVWDCLHGLAMAEAATNDGDPYVMGGVVKENG